MTPFRDSHSRLPFVTHIRDQQFATPLATHISSSNTQIHSRLMFVTPDRAPKCDSLFFITNPLCNSTTDGRTVLTPQHHLPSVPTLTLTRTHTHTIWNLFLGLASTPSYYPPSCPPPLMALCLLIPPLSPFLLQRPLPPPARAPANIPTFITPSAPSSIPPVWEHVSDVLMKLPSTTAEGQNKRSWVTFHFLTSLEDFLMWELDTLQYDAISVCFPSRDTTQPNSLISRKPNSIRHLIMLRKYIHHLVHDSHVSVSSDATDHALEPL